MNSASFYIELPKDVFFNTENEKAVIRGELGYPDNKENYVQCSGPARKLDNEEYAKLIRGLVPAFRTSSDIPLKNPHFYLKLTDNEDNLFPDDEEDLKHYRTVDNIFNDAMAAFKASNLMAFNSEASIASDKR